MNEATQTRKGATNKSSQSRRGKSASSSNPVKSEPITISLAYETRESMIRVAAYLKAEQRGFVNGSPEQDWLEAEREVDKNLAAAS
ncbi:MAG: DUF2934 domain-containing protein [Gammaproteobacteria bacterium]|nr:DUF2934 domain-containing protein [Gammaproteobacteria bacterium]